MTENSSWEQVRRVRTHEQVLAQIEERILEGRLRVGEKLPSERELVEALGVSRNSVREALRALEAMGIIDAHTGSGRDSGSTISGRSTSALSTLLRLHMSLAEISLADLVQVRVQLERYAACGAAAYATQEDSAYLHSLTDAMKSETLAYKEFNELDTEFHVSIARISRNPLVIDLMQALRDAVKERMTQVFAELPDWRSVAGRLVGEHEAIAAAIKEHDVAAAARLVDSHISDFYRDRLHTEG